MPRPKFSKFAATETFWKSFYKLTPFQKESVRAAWLLFRVDPFNPKLRTHTIKRLSSLRKQLVYSVWVEGDLRCLFEIHGVDVGTHDIYKS